MFESFKRASLGCDTAKVFTNKIGVMECPVQQTAIRYAETQLYITVDELYRTKENTKMLGNLGKKFKYVHVVSTTLRRFMHRDDLLDKYIATHLYTVLLELVDEVKGAKNNYLELAVKKVAYSTIREYNLASNVEPLVTKHQMYNV